MDSTERKITANSLVYLKLSAQINITAATKRHRGSHSKVLAKCHLHSSTRFWKGSCKKSDSTLQKAKAQALNMGLTWSKIEEFSRLLAYLITLLQVSRFSISWLSWNLSIWNCCTLIWTTVQRSCSNIQYVGGTSVQALCGGLWLPSFLSFVSSCCL